MGTRSLTRFYSEWNDKEIACVYRQYDGYLDGHGLDLASFLASRAVVNSLSGDDSRVANGMSCLAAQFVAHMKKGAGSIYLYPPGSPNEEYTYEVRGGPERPTTVKVTTEYDGVLFEGPAAELVAFIVSRTRRTR